MATVYFVEWVDTETPGNTPHDTYSFKTAGDTPPTITAATNINFGNVSARDLTTATYPIAKGSNSYTKYFRAQFSGSFTQISNAKFYLSSGAYKTEETIQFSGSVGMATPVTTDASDPLVATAVDGNNVLLGLNAYSVGDLACTSRTLPHANEVESSPDYYSGSRSSLFRLQTLTTSNTEAGVVNAKVFTLQYDLQ